MKWRGIEIADLDDRSLLDAIRQALKICAELWREVARRRLVKNV